MEDNEIEHMLEDLRRHTTTSRTMTKPEAYRITALCIQALLEVRELRHKLNILRLYPE